MATSGNNFASTSKLTTTGGTMSLDSTLLVSPSGNAAQPPPPPAAAAPPSTTITNTTTPTTTTTTTTTTKSRIRRACVACFTAKVRCSGEAPTCARCHRKSVECYYDPAGNSRKGSSQGVLPQPPQPRKRRGSLTEEQQHSSSVYANRVATTAAAAAAVQAAAPVVGRPLDFGGMAATTMASSGGGGGGGGIRPLLASENASEEDAARGSSSSPSNAAAPPPIVVRQPFFRWLGLTSVAPPGPGAPFRSLSVVVAERDPATVTSGRSPTSPTPLDPMLESAEAESTIRTFYTLFESYLPYMPLADTLEALSRGTLSEVVILCMTSLVVRMRPETPGPAAEALADRAKALIVAHLALPSLDIVYSLLLLAYHEHGADRDSGLWAYSGMAIRACVDMGLHKPFATQDAGEAALRSRIFWAVVCLDRIISCGTGRVATLPLSQIEVDLPPPRDSVRTAQGAVLPDPFPFLCRLLLVLGNVSDAVNSNSSPANVPRVPPSVQLELAEFQASVPAALQFSIPTFSAYVSAGCAPAFLLLSLWHQAIHLAIHQSALLFTQPGTVDPDGGRLTPQSGSTAISVGDMLAYSGLISNDAFLCTPTLSQPIMMAGRAASALLKTLPHDTPKYQVEPLERAVVICQTTLERMQRPWRGLSWHLESMTKNAREVDMSRVGSPITTEDRGMLAKARMDNWAIKCSQLLDQLSATPADGEVVGFGLSSWGTTSAPGLSPPPQPTVAVLRSGRTSPLLWHDDLGSPNFFLQENPGFWAGDWLSVQAGQADGGGFGSGSMNAASAFMAPP
ncbi:hypothetical protein JCM3774_005343 [Rhodotorula dairenensis]